MEGVLGPCSRPFTIPGGKLPENQGTNATSNDYDDYGDYYEDDYYSDDYGDDYYDNYYDDDSDDYYNDDYYDDS